MANVMNAQEIKEWMYHKFEENAFMKLADISILEVTCGACKMAMDVDPKKHGNRYGVVHGGALFTLALKGFFTVGRYGHGSCLLQHWS